jgi:hypothetical protein
VVTDVLALWSAVALVLRLLAIVLFCYVASLQWAEFRYKSDLQPLKRFLLAVTAFLVLSNLPILWVHWLRMLGQPTNTFTTSFATVTNAGSMLIIAILLLVIYKYRAES